MRIAQVAPLFESVPPASYGGTERVVAYLTDELVQLGHDVTLFASGDSSTSATLVPVSPRSLRLDTGCVDHLAWHILMIERVAEAAAHFDLIHFHIGHIHLPVVRRLSTPSVTTTHGRLDLPELVPLFTEFHDTPLSYAADDQIARWKLTMFQIAVDAVRSASRKSLVEPTRSPMFFGSVLRMVWCTWP